MPRFDMPNGLEFVTYQDKSTDEVYGWFERDRALVPRSGGWWRTTEPDRAAESAKLVCKLKYGGPA